MFASPFRRVSQSSGPSSVQQWILRQALVASALFAVASSYSDICGTNFANQIHTIGPIDGDLWAITKDNWTVYKLIPCKPENNQLSYCMEVGSPVSVETKWPELAKSVKEAANTTDYDFTFDISVIGYSPDYKDTVLAMYGPFNQTDYFGFLFGANTSIPTTAFDFPLDVIDGSWISSDKNGKTYEIMSSGKGLISIGFYHVYGNSMSILYDQGKYRDICIFGQDDQYQVQLTKDECTTKMVLNLSLRGVLFDNQFSLLASDKAYIFLDVTQKTKMVELSYDTFFPCKKPTTLMLPSTHSNVTPRISAVSGEDMSTTAKGMKPSTIVIYVIIGIVALLALYILIVGVAYYLCLKKGKSSIQMTGDGGTNDNARFTPKDMSQSKAKASCVDYNVASNESLNIGSKI